MLPERKLLHRVLLLPTMLLLAMLLSIRFGAGQIVLREMNQDRQREATERVWRELSDRLRRFVQSRIKSTVDVDDVLQDVFLRIHSRLDDVQKADRLQSWVFQIARNAVADHFRKSQKACDDVDALTGEPDDAGAKSVIAELAGCMGALLEMLPEDQRRALSMYELDGVSQKDVATRESISLSAAKSRIRRGRKSIEQMLKACCEFQFDARGNVVEYKATKSNRCDKSCG